MQTVTSLWRYPVKSMMGEEIRATAIHAKGLQGDRGCALLDCETGKIVSAKNPKLWPGMFDFHARFSNMAASKEIQVTLPDGTLVSTADDNLNAAISEALGRKVQFITEAPTKPQLEEYWPDIEELDNRDIVTDEDMPENTFFDLANIHILSTSTLNELQRLYSEGRFEARRFRPNIIINSEQSGFVENAWIGKTIRIGDEVELKITDHCPRCVMTTLAQADLPRDTRILRTAAQHNQAHVGVYAEVVKTGTVKCGDDVIV